MISRRELLAGVAGGGLSLFTMHSDGKGQFAREIAGLERRVGGRLGFAILDTESGKRLAHRGHERFPLCSTAKLPAAGFVLARVDRHEESLTRHVVYSESDVVTYSPTTGKHVGAPGMTVGEIVEAALTLSDNTAMNLMLDSFGGPSALTEFLRTLGDPTTRLDRKETELNEALAGDPRDTTSPLAMVDTMSRLLLGSALSPMSRERLRDWLLANKTGDHRIRAGVPKDWRVGDKTGTGENGATNDVAVLYPPGRRPILVAAYMVGSRASMVDREHVLAKIGQIAANC